MIRINLLGVTPTAPGAKPPAAPATVARQALIFGVSAVVCAIAAYLPYMFWTRDIDRLQKEFNKEKDRERELASVRAQNERYVARLNELETRINTIQKLQSSRTGPVELMSTLGATVNRTNDLYLLTVTPQGNRLALRGQSNTVESIANFIAALKQSGMFTDVQLRQYFQDDQSNRVSFKFNIDFVVKPPAPPTQTPAAGGQSSPGPGGGQRRVGM